MNFDKCIVCVTTSTIKIWLYYPPDFPGAACWSTLPLSPASATKDVLSVLQLYLFQNHTQHLKMET